MYTMGGYLAMTEEGKARVREGWKVHVHSYLGYNGSGAVHIPGKRVTLYSNISPHITAHSSSDNDSNTSSS